VNRHRKEHHVRRAGFFKLSNLIVTLLRSSQGRHLCGHLFRHRGGSGGRISFGGGGGDLFCLFDKSSARQETIVQWPLSVRGEDPPDRTKRNPMICTHTR